MECRAKLKPLLRATSALRRVLAPGGRRGIHFPPGPTLLGDDDDERDRTAPKPRRWFRAAYARLLRHAGSIPVPTASVTCCPQVAARAVHFDALAGEFVTSASATRRGQRLDLRPASLSSLTRVCDVLGVSAQKRKSVRLTVCPQVTQHHVWRVALDGVLRDLQDDVAASLVERPSPSLQMAEQIAAACTKFLSTTGDESSSSSPPSWMRPTPFKKPPVSPPAAKKWQEVLDMFTDLAKSLHNADDPLLAAHTGKVEAMKEGLYHIRDVVVERDVVGFKEARRQDCLVQYRLSKGLGHSSRCLFTLLLFYLYGTVRDIDIHISKSVSGSKGGSNVVDIHVAAFLTEGGELAVRTGVKQLSRALGIFRFVWEAAHSESDGTSDNGKEVAVKKKKTEDTKGLLELQGHLWGFGVEEKELTYRGDVFHVHQIQIP